MCSGGRNNVLYTMKHLPDTVFCRDGSSYEYLYWGHI